MALKYISFADLLQTKGDGGVGGDNDHRTNGPAGFIVPLTPVLNSPLPSGSGERRTLKITDGDDGSEHSGGFQATDPTDPTDSTCFQGTPLPSFCDDIGQPINTDVLLNAWHPLELTQGRRELKEASNSDDFYTCVDDSADVIAALGSARSNVEPPMVSAEPLAWRVLAAAYYAHHFSCPTCIAAGRGAQYGQRCSAGMASWTSYCECIPKPCSITESS